MRVTHLIKKIKLSKFKNFSLVLKKLSITRPNNFFKVNKFINLQFKTIHSSKGLTFDFVLLDDVSISKLSKGEPE